MKGYIAWAILFSTFACSAKDIVAERPAPQLTEKERACEALVIKKSEPRYPLSAAKKRIAGWASLSFNLSQDGSVKDIKVVDSEPKNVFVSASIKSLEKWQFKEGANVEGCKVVVSYMLKV